MAAVSWFVDLTIKEIKALELSQAQFKGFYWFNEDIPKPTYPLVSNLANVFHIKSCEFLLKWPLLQ